MRTLCIFILVVFGPRLACGQIPDSAGQKHLPHHYFSVNPVNMIFFQQAGLTYEFKPGWLGFGLSAGYIYPNRQEYSNYFIAGPTNYASLGWYHGLYLEPQVNFYVSKPKNGDWGWSFYFALKGVYKYMTVDSTKKLAWYTRDDDYYWQYRKQEDKVNIYGAFVDFGVKFVTRNFFFDINLGPGELFLNHQMVVSGISTGPNSVRYNHPPVHETLKERNATINFSFLVGICF